MPLKLFYTITLEQLEGSKEHFDLATTHFNIFVDSGSAFHSSAYPLVNSLSGDSIISLSSALLEDQDLLAENLPKIYLLLSLTKSSSGRYLLPILNVSGRKDIAANTQALNNYLVAQGMCEVEFPVFDGQQKGFQSVGSCSMLVAIGEADESAPLPTTKLNPGLTNIFFSKDSIGSEGVKKSRSLFEQVLAFNSATTPAPVYIDTNEFEHEIALWKKRAALYQEFLSLSKKVQEKEYYDVVDWYKNEYEILPLWFKRMGHMVKVLTGKRTAGSLFSDKVKKYKQ